MKPARYAIPFHSLKNGIHVFNFLVEHPFFSSFPGSPVREGRVWVKVDLKKSETIMILDFHFHGTLKTLCSLCDTEMDFPIEGERKLLVKFGDKTREEDDEILVLSRGENELNLSQYFYEYIVLSLPMRPVHPSNEEGNITCDPEILKVIEKNLALDKEKSLEDPRWEALKKWKK